MVGSRTITAVLGLTVGLTISVLAWIYFETLLLFIFLPFIPFLFWRPRSTGTNGPVPQVRECPVCGFQTRNPEFEYCPRDGHRLEKR